MEEEKEARNRRRKSGSISEGRRKRGEDEMVRVFIVTLRIVEE